MFPLLRLAFELLIGGECAAGAGSCVISVPPFFQNVSYPLLVKMLASERDSIADPFRFLPFASVGRQAHRVKAGRMCLVLR